MHRKTCSDNLAFLGNFGSWEGDGSHVLSSPSRGQGCSTESCSMDTDTAGPHEAADADEDMQQQQRVDRRKTARRTRAAERPSGPPVGQSLLASSRTVWNEGSYASIQQGSQPLMARVHAASGSDLAGAAQAYALGTPAAAMQGPWRQPDDSFHAAPPAVQQVAGSAGGSSLHTALPLPGASFSRAQSFAHSRSHSQSFSDGQPGGPQQMAGSALPAHNLSAASLPPLPPHAAATHHRRHPSSGPVDVAALGQTLPLPEAAGPAAQLGFHSSGGSGRAASGSQGPPGGDASLGAAGGLKGSDAGPSAAGGSGRSRGRGGRAGASGTGDGGDSEAGGGAAPRGKRESAARDKQRGGNGKTSRELLLLDPKRVRRIIANRMSAAKSKERKQQYAEQLTQMLDDSAGAREGLARQEERLRRDAAALEAYLLDTEREATRLTAHVAALRQEGQLLLRQLRAARLEAGQDPAPPRLDLAAAEAAALQVPGWLELLVEPLSAEDADALKAAGAGHEAPAGPPGQPTAQSQHPAPSLQQRGGAAGAAAGHAPAAFMGARQAAVPELPPRPPSQTGMQAPVTTQLLPCAAPAQQQQQPAQHAAYSQGPGPGSAGAAGAPPGRPHHRPSQSADAVAMMHISQLGLPCAVAPGVAGRLMPGPCSPGQVGVGSGAGAVMGPSGLAAFSGEGRQSLSLPGPMGVARARAEAEALAAAERTVSSGQLGSLSGPGAPILPTQAQAGPLHPVATVCQGTFGMGPAIAMDCSVPGGQSGVGVAAIAPAAGLLLGAISCSAGAVCSAGDCPMEASIGGVLGMQPELLPTQPLLIPSRQVTTSMGPPVTTEFKRP